MSWQASAYKHKVERAHKPPHQRSRPTGSDDRHAHTHPPRTSIRWRYSAANCVRSICCVECASFFHSVFLRLLFVLAITCTTNCTYTFSVRLEAQYRRHRLASDPTFWNEHWSNRIDDEVDEFSLSLFFYRNKTLLLAHRSWHGVFVTIKKNIYECIYIFHVNQCSVKNLIYILHLCFFIGLSRNKSTMSHIHHTIETPSISFWCQQQHGRSRTWWNFAWNHILLSE